MSDKVSKKQKLEWIDDVYGHLAGLDKHIYYAIRADIEQGTDAAPDKPKCLCCERELKPAPTELGWCEIRYNEGMCYDCIESLNASRVCIQKNKPELTHEGIAKT